MNTYCPPKRVPLAARFFTHCRLTVQPPRATASEDNAALGSLQASPQVPGQTTGVACAQIIYSFAGTQRRRLVPTLSLDATSPVRKPANSPGVRWVDGPLRPAQRGPTEPFEIKVYEIDDVERLQKRRWAGIQEVVYFSAKLKILENRQQRITEVRARYDWLKKELEATKQHLMLEPEKWTSECKIYRSIKRYIRGGFPGVFGSPGVRYGASRESRQLLQGTSHDDHLLRRHFQAPMRGRSAGTHRASTKSGITGAEERCV
ncbi:UNVERIFIED_CONTAM: hypothetical protein FKN15_033399 [Acipenser sinensis]